MNKALLFDFRVDKENKKIAVDRAFSAPLDLVWAAWTKPEILDQWWAPKPWKARTKSMDFREGGHWLYAMVGPEGEEHWGRTDYQTIRPLHSFTGLDGFCDSEGILHTTLPRNHWNTQFGGASNATTVHVELTFDTLADLEKILEMGFKEGFSIALEGLDALLPTLRQAE